MVCRRLHHGPEVPAWVVFAGGDVMRRPQLFRVIGLLVAVVAAPALCAQNGAKTAPKEDLQALARGNDEFTFALNTRLCEKPGNVVFSPFSISSALAMTSAGA